MAVVSSLEVYEVEIEELYDGMFWPQLGGSEPAKTHSRSLHFLSTLKEKFVFLHIKPYNKDFFYHRQRSIITFMMNGAVLRAGACC